MGLVQKWPFFLLFFFRQYRPGKCLLRFSRAKKVRARFGQPFFEILCPMLSKQKDMKLTSFSIDSFTMLQVS